MVTRKNILFAIFSVCFSLATVATVELYAVCVKGASYTTDINNWFSFSNSILFLVSFLTSYIIMKKLSVIVENSAISVQSKEKIFSKNAFAISFFTNIIVWSIYWFAFFPGTGLLDGMYILESLFALRSQHPALYIAISGGLVNIVKNMTGSLYIGVAFYSFLQMVIMSAMISYCINWLAKKNVNKLVIAGLIAYFSCTPIIANYSIAFIKDTLFSGFVMLSIPLFYDVFKTQGKCLRKIETLILFLIMCIGASCIRNNGIYMIIAMLIIMLLFAKLGRKQIVLTMIVLVCFNSVTNIGVVKLKQESLGIPLQQIAATIALNGSIEEKNITVIEKIMPLEQWQQLYNPRTVDTIKWGKTPFDRAWLNQNTGEFVNVWCNLLKDNSSIYLKSYLWHTYGFWNICTTADYHPTQSIFLKFVNNSTNYDSYLKENNLYDLGIYSDKIQDVLQLSLAKHTNYLGAGMCFWLIFAFFVINLALKRYRNVVAFFPPLLIWCTLMIAAPISFGFRYSFFFVLCIPLLLVITLMGYDK